MNAPNNATFEDLVRQRAMENGFGQQQGMQQTNNVRCFNNGHLNNSSGLVNNNGSMVNNGSIAVPTPQGGSYPIPASTSGNSHGISKYENFNIKGSYLWEGTGHMFCIHSFLGQGVIMKSATHPQTGKVICQVQLSDGEVVEIDSSELALHVKHKVQSFQDFMRSCSADSEGEGSLSALTRARDSMEMSPNYKRRSQAMKRSHSGQSMSSGSFRSSNNFAGGVRCSTGNTTCSSPGTSGSETEASVSKFSVRFSENEPQLSGNGFGNNNGFANNNGFGGTAFGSNTNAGNAFGSNPTNGGNAFGSNTTSGGNAFGGNAGNGFNNGNTGFASSNANAFGGNNGGFNFAPN